MCVINHDVCVNGVSLIQAFRYFNNNYCFSWLQLRSPCAAACAGARHPKPFILLGCNYCPHPNPSEFSAAYCSSSTQRQRLLGLLFNSFNFLPSPHPCSVHFMLSSILET